MDSLLVLISELKQVNLRLKSDKEILLKDKIHQEKDFKFLKKKLESSFFESQNKIYAINAQNKKEIIDLQETIKLMALQQEELEKKKILSCCDQVIKETTPIKDNYKNSSDIQNPVVEPNYLFKTVNKLNKKNNDLKIEVESLKQEKKTLEILKSEFLLGKIVLEEANNSIKQKYQTSELEKKQSIEENSHLKEKNQFLYVESQSLTKENDLLKQKNGHLELDIRKKELDFQENILEKATHNNESGNPIKYDTNFIKKTCELNKNHESPYLLKTMNKLNKRVVELMNEIEGYKLEKKELDFQKERFALEKMSLESSNNILRERLDYFDLEKKRIDEEIGNLKARNHFLLEKNENYQKEIESLKQNILISQEKDLNSEVLIFINYSY